MTTLAAYKAKVMVTLTQFEADKKEIEKLLANMSRLMSTLVSVGDEGDTDSIPEVVTETPAKKGKKTKVSEPAPPAVVEVAEAKKPGRKKQPGITASNLKAHHTLDQLTKLYLYTLERLSLDPPRGDKKLVKNDYVARLVKLQKDHGPLEPVPESYVAGGKPAEVVVAPVEPSPPTKGKKGKKTTEPEPVVETKKKRGGRKAKEPEPEPVPEPVVEPAVDDAQSDDEDTEIMARPAVPEPSQPAPEDDSGQDLDEPDAARTQEKGKDDDSVSDDTIRRTMANIVATKPVAPAMLSSMAAPKAPVKPKVVAPVEDEELKPDDLDLDLDMLDSDEEVDQTVAGFFQSEHKSTVDDLITKSQTAVAHAAVVKITMADYDTYLKEKQAGGKPKQPQPIRDEIEKDPGRYERQFPATYAKYQMTTTKTTKAAPAPETAKATKPAPSKARRGGKRR